MQRHAKQEQMINWLNDLKERKEPLQLNEAERIINFKKFSRTNIERLKRAPNQTTYNFALIQIDKAKRAWDKEQSK